MSKNKLKRFKDLEAFDRVFQPGYEEVYKTDYVLKGKWDEEVFQNDNPITLELGCGKGEYTVNLAKRFPERNFIGIDIKGSRIWKGAKAANEMDDPWLSEQGPATPKPVEVARDQVALAWSESSEAAFARTAALRRVRLELGIADLVAPARVILRSATAEDPEIYTEFALDLAPHTPFFQFAHARALIAAG